MWSDAQVNLNGFSLSDYATTLMLVILLILCALFIGFFCHYAAKIAIKIVEKIFRLNSGKDSIINSLYSTHVIKRAVYLIPVVFLYNFHTSFDIEYKFFKLYVGDIVKIVAAIYIIFAIAMLLSSILNFIQNRYSRLAVAKEKPIKSYLQVIKIIIFMIATIFGVATLAGQSPAYFLAGLGTLMAMMLLVFRDSILGFVASVQLAAYDMVHLGDSIEMRSFGADGEVVDISLNTIKVQNSDKSIVTIPSYALLTSGMKNWRGMKESGGRRIKRSISIDITSIKICDEKLLARLNEISTLKDALPTKVITIEDYNAYLDLENIRHFTNLGIFCYYLENFLKLHPGVRQDMKMLVRQLEATPTGLPLQLYVFTNDTSSARYEAIQASIMEHIYAVLPVFDLRLFQYPSDHALPYSGQQSIHHQHN